MRYLPASLLDEVTAVLDVKQQIGVGMIQNADGLIDEQVREHVLHTEGHVQDVRHLRAKRKRRKRVRLDNPAVVLQPPNQNNKQTESHGSNSNIQSVTLCSAGPLEDLCPAVLARFSPPSFTGLRQSHYMLETMSTLGLLNFILI